MTFYESYNGVLEGAKTVLQQNVSGLENVAVGGDFKVERLPMVVIDPAVTPIKKEALGRHLHMALRFTVVYIVGNTEPKDWREKVAEPLGGIVDVFLAHPKLDGAALDVYPVRFAPNAEVPMPSGIFYGGLVEFEATVLYKKT